MTSVNIVARRLAAALAGERLTEKSALTRCARVMNRRWRWLGPFARRLLQHFGIETRPRRFQLERFIRADIGFQRACVKHAMVATPELNHPPKMSPMRGRPQGWRVPAFRTPNALALRLHLSSGDLAWFSDVRNLERHLPAGPLRHYHYYWRRKKNGTPRLIESPKQRLKAIQRWILTEMLDRIPPHPAAHGFRRGRSIVSFAQPHVGQRVVLRIDLKDFFPSISRSRLIAIFMTAGYPEDVATVIAGLCVNTAPLEVIRSCPAASNATTNPSPAETRRIRNLYGRPHLPQGAPTSPGLANLAAYRLDCRLAGLARAVGAEYTRYADDLVFSGDTTFAAMIDRFHVRVCAIALDEGFEVQTRKTRVMRQSVAQRAAGLVLNSRMNVPRRDYDELKATLHNCARHGPGSQNRAAHADFRSHLSGRIGHVEQVNPHRGARLRAMFERVQWAD